MFVRNWTNWFSFLNQASKRVIRRSRPKSSCRPLLEEMEPRMVPSGGCELGHQVDLGSGHGDSGSHTSYQFSLPPLHFDYKHEDSHDWEHHHQGNHERDMAPGRAKIRAAVAQAAGNKTCQSRSQASSTLIPIIREIMSARTPGLPA
jgi:hypothetical protein